ncbi:murein hydrolase activator EnvC family protein [Fulvivirga sediminis]|uniref:Peptidoglycan DD-metalloendopeptidase family protein n=1 Tax=Fulvivirga sediminis TaxID=2803949 RepID=A0A937JX08_9BACT|nr:peptidoglycan DD-metalloendopeptidase family protein [Fulvivirga sediminis]MBL3655028.1 peptidoglycan DD-metalloendopeptidase family protein [Fulvivirga sediminis]
MSASKNLSLIFVFILFCGIYPSFGQKSKAQLQKEKQENLKKIEEAEKILKETTGKKQNTLGQLNALNQRIKTQEDLIGSIRKEITLLTEEIEENNQIISSLEQDLKKLKEEYAAMVYAAHKANQGFNKLTFIFSAKSFNQLLMRLKYMEQYSDARKNQAEEIVKVQETLGAQVTVIKSKMTEKNDLLAEQLEENKSLSNLKQNQNQLVKNLQRQENKLKDDLTERRDAVARLDKIINDIIKEEMAKAKVAEKKDSEASLKLANQFADNKSKLPWPVSGFVSQKFGRQNHPVLKSIVLNNTGIYIQTKENEKVKTVFTGEVKTVAFVPLIGNTVIVTHGGYFTVYAGLKDVFVKKGQEISTGQEIGTILTNKDGVSELRFEIWKNSQATDPQQWLTRK